LVAAPPQRILRACECFVVEGFAMRVLPSLCALLLSLACPAAHAQAAATGESTPSQPAKPTPAVTAPVPDVRSQTDAWFKDCKHGWDAGTHMSRRDYERTCLRMAQERVKFMRDWEKSSAERAKSK
jgi:transcription elongation factor